MSWSGVSLASRPASEAPVPAESGVLGPSFHLAEFYLDLSPFRYIADRYRPRSVLDVGCGLGAYLLAFERWGAGDITGIDGFESDGAVLVSDRICAATSDRPSILGQTFDLVLCTEVVEHLPASAGQLVLETIARHARDRIVFSAARPGQPGRGHINCQPVEYWIEAWQRLGWTPDVFDSCAMRFLSTYHWFRRNLLVLTRSQAGGATSSLAAADFESFEVGAVPWDAQAPRVHVYPLEEPPPALAPGVVRQRGATTDETHDPVR